MVFLNAFVQLKWFFEEKFPQCNQLIRDDGVVYDPSFLEAVDDKPKYLITQTLYTNVQNRLGYIIHFGIWA